MKLLRLIAKRLPRFNEPLDLSFYEQESVSEKRNNQLFGIAGKALLNSIEIFDGDTASGKTLTLKVIQFVFDVLNNEQLNYIESSTILCGAENVELNIFFLDNKNMVCDLHVEVVAAKQKTGEYIYHFLQEELYEKTLQSIKSAKDLVDFCGMEPTYIRNNNELYLTDDVSVVIAHNKKSHDAIENYCLLSPDMCATSLWNWDNISEETIRNFDPNIEKISFENCSKNKVLHLKFRGENELILRNMHEMKEHISRGTINGTAIFQMAEEILQSGGYLLIDDIEIYLSRKKLIQLISLFRDNQLNKQGGVLVFTTKWLKSMDGEFSKTEIYAVSNQDGITVKEKID